MWFRTQDTAASTVPALQEPRFLKNRNTAKNRTFMGPDQLQHLHALKYDATVEEGKAELHKRRVGCITRREKPCGKQKVGARTHTHTHTRAHQARSGHLRTRQQEHTGNGSQGTHRKSQARESGRDSTYFRISKLSTLLLALPKKVHLTEKPKYMFVCFGDIIYPCLHHANDMVAR